MILILMLEMVIYFGFLVATVFHQISVIFDIFDNIILTIFFGFRFATASPAYI